MKKTTRNRHCVLGFALSSFYVGLAGAVCGVIFLPSGPERDKVWREYANTREVPSREIMLIGNVYGLSMAISAHHEKGVYSLPGRSNIYVIDLKDGAHLSKVKDPLGTVLSVSISPDGRKAIGGGGGGRDGVTLCLWDLESNVMIQQSEEHSGYVRAVAYAPVEEQAIVGDDSGTISLWDLDEFQVIRRFVGHAGSIRRDCLSWAADGRTFLSGGSDGSICLWHMETGAQLACFNPGGRQVESLALSPDGKYALSSYLSGGQLVIYWDLQAQREINRFAVPAHSSLVDKTYVTSVAFAPDGETALFGLAFGTVLWWDIHDWKEIAMNRLYEHELAFVAFSEDGGECISVGCDSDDVSAKASLRFWNLPERER